MLLWDISSGVQSTQEHLILFPTTRSSISRRTGPSPYGAEAPSCGWTASRNLRESLKVLVNVCTQASVPSAGVLGARWQP